MDQLCSEDMLPAAVAPFVGKYKFAARMPAGRMGGGGGSVCGGDMFPLRYIAMWNVRA